VLVDTDAVLVGAVSLESLKPIPRNLCKVGQAGSCREHVEFAPSGLFDALETWTGDIVEELFGILAAKTLEHDV